MNQTRWKVRPMLRYFAMPMVAACMHMHALCLLAGLRMAGRSTGWFGTQHANRYPVMQFLRFNTSTTSRHGLRERRLL